MNDPTSRPRAPRVSVALCTHNGEPYIEEQLRSILDQTVPVDEIVLSDDASTDGTVALAERVVQAHLETQGSAPELIVLRNDPALRVIRNFEQALMRTTGDLIALSDQDDVWHPEKIATLRKAFESSATQLVFTDARLVDRAGEPLGRTLFEGMAISPKLWRRVAAGESLKVILRHNIVTGATVVMRRQLVDRAAPFPEFCLHDEWLALVAAVSGGVKVVDLPLIDYRQHGGNQVGAPSRSSFGAKLRLLLEPRDEENQQRLEKAHSQVRELARVEGVSAEQLALAGERVAFEQARQRYPRARILRPFPVLKQVVGGRYGTDVYGMQSAIRDCLQRS